MINTNEDACDLLGQTKFARIIDKIVIPAGSFLFSFLNEFPYHLSEFIQDIKTSMYQLLLLC